MGENVNISASLLEWDRILLVIWQLRLSGSHTFSLHPLQDTWLLIHLLLFSSSIASEEEYLLEKHHFSSPSHIQLRIKLYGYPSFSFFHPLCMVVVIYWDLKSIVNCSVWPCELMQAACWVFRGHGNWWDFQSSCTLPVFLYKGSCVILFGYVFPSCWQAMICLVEP